MDGEREGVEISGKRLCPNRLSREVFEVFCPVSEMESAGGSLGCSVGVLPDVTVPFSDVNVDCEVVSLISDCEFVEPFWKVS